MPDVETFYSEELSKKTSKGIGALLFFLCGFAMIFVLIGEELYFWAAFSAALTVLFFILFINSLKAKKIMKFISISDAGINFNGEQIALWEDVQSIDEQTVKQDQGLVYVYKKELVIKFFSKTTNQVATRTIEDSYNGYLYIKEKIKKFWKNQIS